MWRKNNFTSFVSDIDLSCTWLAWLPVLLCTLATARS